MVQTATTTVHSAETICAAGRNQAFPVVFLARSKSRGTAYPIPARRAGTQAMATKAARMLSDMTRGDARFASMNIVYPGWCGLTRG